MHIAILERDTVRIAALFDDVQRLLRDDVVAALVAVLTAAAVIPSRLDGATTTWPQRSVTRTATPTLVSVKVTTTNDAPSAPVADAMRSPARRRLFASCRNPGQGTSAYALMGNRVSGATVAHLNPTGGPAGAAR